MDVFLYSAKCILPIILMMAFGYLLRRLNIVSEGFVKQANQFVFKVTLPIQLFRNIAVQSLSGFNGKLVLFAVAAVLLEVVLLWLIVPRLEKSRAVTASMIQGIFRGNFVILGLPLAQNMFGEEGVLPTALLLPIAIPLFNILAVVILSYFGENGGKVNIKGTLLGIVKNPLIIASVLGIIMSLLPFDLPGIIDSPIKDIGATATPLALVMLGAQFDFGKLKGNLKRALSCTAVRMVLVPALVLALAVLLGFRGPELGAIFILFAAPTAVSSYVMAQNMGADADTAGQLVVLTTLACGVTLFLQTALLRYLTFI